MDQIESINASYHKIKNELDNIEKQIGDSDYASDPDFRVAAHNYFTTFAIAVVNMNGDLARCESCVIEAEFALKSNFQEVDSWETSHSVTKIIRRQW